MERRITLLSPMGTKVLFFLLSAAISGCGRNEQDLPMPILVPTGGLPGGLEWELHPLIRTMTYKPDGLTSCSVGIVIDGFENMPPQVPFPTLRGDPHPFVAEWHVDDFPTSSPPWYCRTCTVKYELSTEFRPVILHAYVAGEEMREVVRLQEKLKGVAFSSITFEEYETRYFRKADRTPRQ